MSERPSADAESAAQLTAAVRELTGAILDLCQELAQQRQVTARLVDAVGASSEPTSATASRTTDAVEPRRLHIEAGERRGEAGTAGSRGDAGRNSVHSMVDTPLYRHQKPRIRFPKPEDVQTFPPHREDGTVSAESASSPETPDRANAAGEPPLIDPPAIRATGGGTVHLDLEKKATTGQTGPTRTEVRETPAEASSEEASEAPVDVCDQAPGPNPADAASGAGTGETVDTAETPKAAGTEDGTVDAPEPEPTGPCHTGDVPLHPLVTDVQRYVFGAKMAAGRILQANRVPRTDARLDSVIAAMLRAKSMEIVRQSLAIHNANLARAQLAYEATPIAAGDDPDIFWDDNLLRGYRRFRTHWFIEQVLDPIDEEIEKLKLKDHAPVVNQLAREMQLAGVDVQLNRTEYNPDRHRLLDEAAAAKGNRDYFRMIVVAQIRPGYIDLTNQKIVRRAVVKVRLVPK